MRGLGWGAAAPCRAWDGVWGPYSGTAWRSWWSYGKDRVVFLVALW